MTVRSALTQLGTNSAVYGVAGILQRFTGLLLLPFFTGTLSTADYGVLSLTGVVTAAAVGILNLGTANSISLIYFNGTDIRSKSAVIWTGAGFLALNCLLIQLVLYPALPFVSNLVFGSDQYTTILLLALVGLSFSVVADPFLSYLRMNNKPLQYISVTLLVFCATTGLSVWLVLFRRAGVTGMVFSQTAGQLLLLVVSLAVIGGRLPFSCNRALVKPLVLIGFPSVVGSFATLLLSFSDRWLIERFLGIGDLGVYSVGASFGMFMALLVGAFDTAWPPFFASYINRREEARKIFPLIFTYYVMGFGVICLAFFALAKPVVSMLTAKPFHEAFLVVGLVAASQMLYGAYSILGTGIYFARKLGFLSAFKWLAAGINIGLNFILIPKYGITGAALAMFAGYLSLLPMAYFASRAEFPLAYEWRRVSALLIVLVGMSAIVWTASRSLHIGAGAAVGLSGVLLAVLCFYRLILSGAERSQLVSVAQSRLQSGIRKLEI